MLKGIALAPSLVAWLAACACAKPVAPAAAARRPEALRARVLRTFPHDPGAFTQGLLYFEGKVYESTGLYGKSNLRRVDPASGAVEAQLPLPPALFGEGLARVGSRLFVLTWQSGRALVLRVHDFALEREHGYQGEGWGLCFDGKHLFMSDGSDRLIRRDPVTFAELGTLLVRRAGEPLRHLNELECAHGAVYANVWQTQHIARIDPRTGEVTGWIDASGLLSAEEASGADVLNGIAHVPGTRRFFVTGKLWPKLFEVEFVPAR